MLSFSSLLTCLFHVRLHFFLPGSIARSFSSLLLPPLLLPLLRLAYSHVFLTFLLVFLLFLFSAWRLFFLFFHFFIIIIFFPSFVWHHPLFFFVAFPYLVVPFAFFCAILASAQTGAFSSTSTSTSTSSSGVTRGLTRRMNQVRDTIIHSPRHLMFCFFLFLSCLCLFAFSFLAQCYSCFCSTRSFFFFHILFWRSARLDSPNESSES